VLKSLTTTLLTGAMLFHPWCPRYLSFAAQSL
jgi:hypothetical protein